MIKNPNHPKPGCSITAEPIRSQEAIKSIKKLLKNDYRNYCLFIVGINTNLKAKELLHLKVGMVKNLKPGGSIKVRGEKSGEGREITFNKPCVDAIKQLLKTKRYTNEEYLFQGKEGALRPPSLNRLVKQWCQSVKLTGNYGSQTMRKTFGYQQGVQYGVALPTLMKTFNHSTQKETLKYLCIKTDQIKSIYENEI